jgi:hypothetical protein
MCCKNAIKRGGLISVHLVPFINVDNKELNMSAFFYGIPVYGNNMRRETL